MACFGVYSVRSILDNSTFRSHPIIGAKHWCAFAICTFQLEGNS
jgi:hypothetical protein